VATVSMKTARAHCIKRVGPDAVAVAAFPDARGRHDSQQASNSTASQSALSRESVADLPLVELGLVGTFGLGGVTR
jgi:hypothetical protein